MSECCHRGDPARGFAVGIFLAIIVWLIIIAIVIKTIDLFDR